MKVLFITNLPAPYKVDFFNALSRYCEVVVLYERQTAANREKAWKAQETAKFEYHFLRGVRFGPELAFCPSVIRHLRKNTYDFIVVSGYASPTSILANLYLKKKKKPFFIGIDGCLERRESPRKYKLKRKLLSNAQGVIVPGEASERVIRQYIGQQGKIFTAPFSSVSDADLVTTRISDADKRKLREKLGFTDAACVVLYVGSVTTYRKGVDVLLRAMASVPGAKLCVVGGFPDELLQQTQREAGADNVVYVGFKSKKDLAEYYAMSDIFAFPTREDIWGLVVNEAMSFGLPVVTTDRCGAGLELIREGQNGYIVPVGSVDALAEKITRLAGDATLREQMFYRNTEKMRQCTIETMADGYYQIFSKVEREETE